MLRTIGCWVFGHARIEILGWGDAPSRLIRSTTFCRRCGAEIELQPGGGRREVWRKVKGSRYPRRND